MATSLLSSWNSELSFPGFRDRCRDLLCSGAGAAELLAVPDILSVAALEVLPPDRADALLAGAFDDTDVVRCVGACFYRLLTGSSPYQPALCRPADYWRQPRVLADSFAALPVFHLLPRWRILVEHTLTTPAAFTPVTLAAELDKLDFSCRFGVLERLLGKGATSCVYQVCHEDVLLALKLVTAESAVRLRRESDFLLGDSHPGLLRCYGYWADDVCAGMLLEPLAGCRPDASGFTVLRDALAHIHSRGLLHGDIRRNNIGVAGDGRPVLFDLSHLKPFDSAAAAAEIEQLQLLLERDDAVKKFTSDNDQPLRRI